MENLTTDNLEGAGQPSPQSGVKLEDLEKGYATLREAYMGVAEVIKSTQGEPYPGASYQSSPFDSVQREMERALKKAREDLIERAVREYNDAFTPNLRRDPKTFADALNPERFDLAPIRSVFEADARDSDKLRADSLAQLRTDAEHLIPWGVVGLEAGGWDKRGPKLQRQGRMLPLHFHTWHSMTGGDGFISVSDTTSLRAFDALVLVALNGSDPATVHAPEGMNYLGYFVRREGSGDNGAVFYAKHRNDVGLIESFQFFMNGSLKVYFKTEEDAKKVEEVLTGRTAPTIQATVEGSA